MIQFKCIFTYLLVCHVVNVLAGDWSKQSKSTNATEELLITGIQFDCTGKPTGFYKDTKYCDLFHVCVGFKQRKTYGCPQIGDKFYYDDASKM
jgi:hypothetical protein